MLCASPWSRFNLTTSVVIDTDYMIFILLKSSRLWSDSLECWLTGRNVLLVSWLLCPFRLLRLANVSEATNETYIYIHTYTDYIGSCKSNYHTIRATTALWHVCFFVFIAISNSSSLYIDYIDVENHSTNSNVQWWGFSFCWNPRDCGQTVWSAG
jgi:F0F1-type ATP synthase membrane subunit a